MTSYTHVFVGNYGEYVIPEDVYARALELTPEIGLKDRRTKASKYLEQWGRARDAYMANQLMSALDDLKGDMTTQRM